MTKKEKAYKKWLELGGEKAPRGTLSMIAKDLRISSNSIRVWKKREWCVDEKQKEKNVTNTQSVTDECNVSRMLQNVTENQEAIPIKRETKKSIQEEENRVKRLAKSQEHSKKLKKISRMTMQGYTAKEIAEAVDFHASTIAKWRKRYNLIQRRDELQLEAQARIAEVITKEREKRALQLIKGAEYLEGVALEKIKDFHTGKHGASEGKKLAAEINAIKQGLETLDAAKRYTDSWIGAGNAKEVSDLMLQDRKYELEQERFAFEKEKATAMLYTKLLEIEKGNKENTSEEIRGAIEEQFGNWEIDTWEETE